MGHRRPTITRRFADALLPPEAGSDRASGHAFSFPRQRRGDIHREKTAEERFHMLARGWPAYPVTPVARATTAEVRL